MPKRSKRSIAASAVETCEAESTVIGPAFAMPEPGVAALAMAQEAPIDFQARQDSISPNRRTPGPKLAPKVKRTSAKPAPAKETMAKP